MLEDIKISNTELLILEGFLEQLNLKDRKDYMDKLFDYLKIKSFDQLPKSRFESCCVSLQAKIKQSLDVSAK